MVVKSQTLPAEYWQEVKINNQDLEFLHNHLFENETPMSAGDLVRVFIEGRIRMEVDALAKKRKAGGKVYLPKNQYKKGEKLAFPMLDWKKGEVVSSRPGFNPQFGGFEVIIVEMDAGERRMFATGLDQHALNEQGTSSSKEEGQDVGAILATYGESVEHKLELAFQADEGLVRIAGKWFPKALLIDVNQGHLNLAEAVLDMAGGEPLPTSDLLKDVELPKGVNPKLAEFSLNLALQEDDRFDEVGPAGKVLWCLRRLEPQSVREIPLQLRYTPIKYDRAILTDEMIALEAQLDDELAEVSNPLEVDVEEVTISLIFPHWRAGTLPVTTRVKSMFPTAYESPRVRFTLVDGVSGDQIPAWVVREHRYVSGLREWFESQELMPGSLVHIRHGENPGEVIIKAHTHRTTKDWVRTAIVGTDGGVVFALLKQTITAEINDRMTFAIPTVEAVDQLWEESEKKPVSFEKLVVSVMYELTKLNPQGHVHAQELYSAVNIIRRVPIAPLLALLAGSPEKFVHVGDLHYRLGEKVQED